PALWPGEPSAPVPLLPVPGAPPPSARAGGGGITGRGHCPKAHPGVVPLLPGPRALVSNDHPDGCLDARPGHGVARAGLHQRPRAVPRGLAAEGDRGRGCPDPLRVADAIYPSGGPHGVLATPRHAARSALPGRGGRAGAAPLDPTPFVARRSRRALPVRALPPRDAPGLAPEPDSPSPDARGPLLDLVA